MEFVEKHQFIDGLVERESTLPCVYCGNEKWALLIDEPIDLSNQQLLNFAWSRPFGRLRQQDLRDLDGKPEVTVIMSRTGVQQDSRK